MEEQYNDSSVDKSSYLNETENEQSFVGKVKSIITKTPLSKWFRKETNRPSVRRRNEDSEDEIQEMQPPSKKVKLPTNVEKNNYSSVYSETVIHNEVKKHSKICEYFPEPVAGPSGIHTNTLTNGISVNSVHNRLTNSDILNGRKDSDSEESTSGYSSVAKIGSKEQVYQSPSSSKQTSPSQKVSNSARSLFQTTPNRSTNTHMNTSLSSRRPSFNASTFGSPNFVDRTLLTKKIINSPFYNGRTIYGGASAYGHNVGRTHQDLRANLKSSMQIKPVNKNDDSGNVVLGKTARRILETLEQYSSPVNDAKKIPTVSKKPRDDGLLSKYIGANPYVKKGPVTRELQVPSVSDLLKMKQKTKLQDSTEAVRQIATTSKSNLNTENYKLGGENEKEKHTSKIKTRVNTVRQKIIIEETVPEVNLNPISLPITNLPKFDFIIPPPATSEPAKESSPKMKVTPSKVLSFSPSAKAQTAQKSDNIIAERNLAFTKPLLSSDEFKFSDPLVIAENLKSIVAINNFKFSEPVSKGRKTESSQVSVNFKMPENKMPILKPKHKSPAKPEPVLKTGSVIDALNKFKPPANSWECNTCLIQNSADKSKCIACETPKTKAPITETPKGFGTQLKKPSDKWECPVCMIQNPNADTKCAACAAAKPVSKSATESVKTPNEFGSKFKLPNDMWECTVCMVRNKNEQTKCIACESPAPKSNVVSLDGFNNKFKPPASTWECSTCLVRNKDETTKCIACETPRSSLLKPSASGSFGGAFKLQSNEWECGVCMARNKTENSKCVCCEATKPGAVVSTEIKNKPISTFNFGIDKASATSFNFGIPASAQAEVPKLDVKPASIFGENAKTTTNATGGFSFGIVPQSKEEKPVELQPVVVEPTQPKKNPLLKPTEKLPEPAKPAPIGFQFDLAPSSMAPAVQPSQIKPAVNAVEPEKSKLIPLTNSSQNQAKENVFANKIETAKTNLFNFGAKPNATSNVNTIVQDANKKPTEANQSVTSTSIFKFGTSPKPAANSSVPVFGSSVVSSSNNEFSSTFPKLGGGNPFKNTMSSNTTGVKPFSFESPVTKSDEPPKKVPMFAFQTKTPTQPTAQSSGFAFTASNNAPLFNFASAKAENSSNVFGGTSATENNTPNGAMPTFNFGSMTNNTQKAAGFSFGASSAATTTAQAGFNFGSAAAPSTGGFNFTGAPISNTFDPNAKRTFNFTAGSTVTAFTAQPTGDGGMPAPRKIKKAIRRTQR